MATRTEGRLSATDSLMWRIEADPVLRSAVVVVGLLDRAPGRARLRAVVERVVREVPGLRQRVAAPPLGIGRPAWEEAPAFWFEHHVRHVRVPHGRLDEVFELAEPDATAPFDPERPAWSLTIVDGLDGGRAAFVLRFHHAITDGVGALGLARNLLDDVRWPTAPGRPRLTVAGPETVSVPEPEVRPAGPAAALRAAGDAAAATGRVLHRAATDPTAVATGGWRLASSVRRLLTPAPGRGSDVLAGRGIDRSLRAFTVPLDDLRRAARATGGTVNDVLLAAVGGGTAAYHRHRGAAVSTLRVSVPIDRRRPDDPAGGNRFTPTRFVLPVDDPDPAVRARIAGALVRGWRSEPSLGAAEAIAAGLDLLPRAAVTKLFAGLLREVDVNVVDLRGLDGRAYLAGGRLDRLWAFAPTAGTACSVTLLSHHDVGCVAITCDTAAVADPDDLVKCLQRAFDEVLALGAGSDGGGGDARRRGSGGGPS